MDDITLTPSALGAECIGNGEHEEVECCCDECDYFLFCFPDWETMMNERSDNP